MNDAGSDAERPCRGRDEESGGLDVALEPAAGRELVLDQPVGGGGVGHAQQRLGQYHEGEALFGRQRIGVQKIFDTAEPGRFGADRLDQTPGAGIDVLFGGAVARRLGEKRSSQFFVCRRVRCVERRQLAKRRIHRASLFPRVEAGEGRGFRSPHFVVR